MALVFGGIHQSTAFLVILIGKRSVVEGFWSVADTPLKVGPLASLGIHIHIVSGICHLKKGVLYFDNYGVL